MEKFVGELTINYEKLCKLKYMKAVPQRKQKQCEDLFEKKFWNYHVHQLVEAVAKLLRPFTVVKSVMQRAPEQLLLPVAAFCT